MPIGPNLTTEALRELHFDSSQRLREAFIREDQGLSGSVPVWKVAACFKSVGLHIPERELPGVIAKYLGQDQRFRWLAFVQTLEKRTSSYSRLPRSLSNMSKSPSVKALRQRQGALPPLHRAASNDLQGGTGLHASLSKYLGGGGAEGMSGMFMSPSGRGAIKMAEVGAGGGGLRKSASTASMGQRVSSIRSMASQAEMPGLMMAKAQAGDDYSGLLPDLYMTKSQARLQKAIEWQVRLHETQAFLKKKAEEEEASKGLEYEDDGMKISDVVKMQKELTAAEQAKRREELKKSAMVSQAQTALNSRFADMHKAFQYVDMDRSGTLDKKEIRRALDMWNIPIEEAKLDELIEACDRDGDGQVDYKEFVDVLARDTVNSEAMGKRGMNAKEALGVDSLDKQFLGHHQAGKHAYAADQQ